MSLFDAASAIAHPYFGRMRTTPSRSFKPLLSCFAMKSSPCTCFGLASRPPCHNGTCRLRFANGRRKTSLVSEKRRCHQVAKGRKVSTIVGAISEEEMNLDLTPARKAFCYGCGVELQAQNTEGIGFIEADKLQVKAKHGQLKQLLCARCVSLTHGKMVPAVWDLHQQVIQGNQEDPVNQKKLISPEGFREQLKDVRKKASVVVLVVDVLDIPGSFLSSVRDLVGRNPIFLVGNKFDLLPKDTDLVAVADYLRDMVASKGVNVVNTLLVSSKTKKGISFAASNVLKMRRGRDIFVMGAANVGKSAFVRALLGEMRNFASVNFDPQSRSEGRFLPVESSMPGTTLGMIPLRAFSSGGTLYDTPGVHLFHRMPHLLSPEEMGALHPRRRLKPYIAPSPWDLTQGDSLDPEFEPETVSATYLWGGIARIDIIDAPPQTTLVFYGPQSLQVHSFEYVEGEVDIAAEVGDEPAESEEGDAGPSEEGAELDGLCFGRKSIELRGGLRVAREFEVNAYGVETRIGDISVSGVSGWCSVIVPFGKGVVRCRVWTPKGVEAFLRPAMPVEDPLRRNPNER